MRHLSLLLIGLWAGAAGCIPALPAGEGSTSEPSGSKSGTNPSGKADGNCGAQTFPVSLSTYAPNVYFVVDRSGSMSDSFGGGQTGSKWDAAQAAMNALLIEHNGKASWGLSLFPPTPSVDLCGKAIVDVGLQLGSENAILSRINGLTNQALNSPRGSTPTADALKTVRDQAGLNAPSRNNYAVLVTDGLPVCNSAADVGAVIDEMYNRTPSVTTFVIGIGAETASNAALLNEWANKGHSARVGAASKYYQANDVGQLIDAFSAVVGEAATCTFRLESAPEDPALVVGQLDGLGQPSDAANGFTYDALRQSVVFHGAACDQIKQGKVKKVDVVYGCPGVQLL